MITVRRSDSRGHFDHGWLDTRHTFSFASYFDREHMSFRSLRVINEDRVAPGEGFPPHSHQDMEILTVVVSGALEHRDSMGNGSVVRPGDIQAMSAGTGVTHSEMNHSSTEPVHFLQIWLKPSQQGFAPRYGQKSFPEELRRGRLCLMASPDGRDGSVPIHQQALLYACILPAGTNLTHEIAPDRHAWVQVIHGSMTVNSESLSAGDGAAVSEEAGLALAAEGQDSEFLLFDLA